MLITFPETLYLILKKAFERSLILLHPFCAWGQKGLYRLRTCYDWQVAKLRFEPRSVWLPHSCSGLWTVVPITANPGPKVCLKEDLFQSHQGCFDSGRHIWAWWYTPGHLSPEYVERFPLTFIWVISFHPFEDPTCSEFFKIVSSELCLLVSVQQFAR